MILISTIGKNLDKLSQFIDDEYDEVYFLISANEKENKSVLQKKSIKFLRKLLNSSLKKILSRLKPMTLMMFS